MIRNISLQFVVAIFSLLLLADDASASGYTGGFADAWERSWVAASGSVTFVGSKEDRISGSEGKYRLQIDQCYKGTPENEPIVFYDLHYQSSAGLHLTSGSNYLVFLQDSEGRNRSMVGANTNKNIISSLCAIKITDNTESEIKRATALYQTYQKVKDLDERRSYLLQQLEEPNRYVARYFLREILVNKMVEAIPHFQEKLKQASSERDKLDQAANLRCLGVNIRPQLLAWLKDPDFKTKAEVIEELVRLKDKDAMSAISKFIDNQDEYLAVTARSALLRMGQREIIPRLLEMIKVSTNSTVRYNAIHVLNWNYNGSFTPDELEAIKASIHDTDESISRVAGFILEKDKQKQKGIQQTN